MRLRTSLVLALSLGVIACKEPPSYRARWGILDDVPPGCLEAEDAELTSSCECSERGFGDIRLVTRDVDGVPVDVSTRPCFPPAFAHPDGLVAGPALPPGEYAIEVRGIKRQRGADEMRVGPDLAHLDHTLVWGADQYSYQWIDNDLTDDPDDVQLDFIEAATPSCTAGVDEPACVAGAIACDCVSLTIEGGETVDLIEFELAAPPPCDNGVDDDQDGLVDGADPACESPSGTEDAPIGGAQVRVDVAFFDHNPHLSCEGLAELGVQGLRASLFELDCAQKNLPENMGIAPTSTTDLACVIGSAFFSVTGAVGDKCLEIAAIDGAGQPRTVAEQRGLSLVSGPASFFAYEVDFEAGDFAPPVEARARVGIKFDGGGDLPRGCVAEGLPDITKVEIEVRDAHGGVLAVPITDQDGAPLDGSERPCPSEVLRTDLLTWGGYTMSIVAKNAADEPCFSTDAQPIPLAPGDVAVVVPPAGGSLPAGCG